jgi:hypothetical protein
VLGILIREPVYPVLTTWLIFHCCIDLLLWNCIPCPV